MKRRFDVSIVYCRSTRAKLHRRSVYRVVAPNEKKALAVLAAERPLALVSALVVRADEVFEAPPVVECIQTIMISKVQAKLEAVESFKKNQKARR